MIDRWLQKFWYSSPMMALRRLLKKIYLPGFGGVNLYQVLKFFVTGLLEGYLTTRAASISFSFFLAIFPFTIFLLTIIAYIPIDNFQNELIHLLQQVVPPKTWEAIDNTLTDIIQIKRGGLLSLGFVLALFFANNGVNSILTSFNATFHSIEIRTFFSQLRASIVLTIVLSVMFITSVTLVIFSESIIDRLEVLDIVSRFQSQLLGFAQLIVVLALIFFSITLLYYYGPANRKEHKFFSPGAILSTLLLWGTSYGFAAYVTNFASYNQIYGSIGTLIIILLWIYINAIVLLVGFELNASIVHARKTSSREIELQQVKLSRSGEDDQ